MNLCLDKFKTKGFIDVPSSKSYAHRVLIMAFLTKSKVLVEDIEFSDDINYTLNALIEMGAVVKKYDNAVEFVDYNECPSELILEVGLSASTLRFLIPIATSLADHVIFKADRTLLKRPLSAYYPLLNKGGVDYLVTESELILKGKLNLDHVSVNGEISSQFVTGMLFYICLHEEARLRVEGESVSCSYIEMTKDVMNRFGYDVIFDKGVYRVLKIDNFIETIAIEKDYSQLSFWAVLGVLNGEIKVSKFNKESLQGDRVIIDILKKLDCLVIDKEDFYIFKESKINKDIEIDLQECIDLGPILFVLAAFNKGVTTFYNVDRLMVKESDRLNAMKTELEKIGVDFKCFDSKVIIKGCEGYANDCAFNTYGDHRVAMSLMVLACLIKGNNIVKDVECISKSYPKFINHLFSLKI